MIRPRSFEERGRASLTDLLFRVPPRASQLFVRFGLPRDKLFTSL
jgi:hypothetical protein